VEEVKGRRSKREKNKREGEEVKGRRSKRKDK
jgi:hypothetical protein